MKYRSHQNNNIMLFIIKNPVQLRGHPFMMSKKITFLTPSVHMHPHGPNPPPPCGRPHAVDMKYTPLSWNGLYNDLLDLKLKFDYMIIIYLNCTISNLYH